MASQAAGPGPIRPGTPWPRTSIARRYGREILFLIVLKIVLLVLLWSVFIRPQHRADQSPHAVAKHLVPTPVPPAPRP